MGRKLKAMGPSLGYEGEKRQLTLGIFEDNEAFHQGIKMQFEHWAVPSREIHFLVLHLLNLRCNSYRGLKRLLWGWAFSGQRLTGRGVGESFFAANASDSLAKPVP